ncbi:hypothetical protein IWX75_000598 [Arthrobacter sp. CAN_A6]
MPVGGADTGAAVADTNEASARTLAGVGTLGAGAVLGLLMRRRHSVQS